MDFSGVTAQGLDLEIPAQTQLTAGDLNGRLGLSPCLPL